MAHDHVATAMMKAQFMTLWDGFASTNDQIIVMGATNRPQDVDSAILRQFPARFEVPMPNAQQRENSLKVILGTESLSERVDLSSIPELDKGLSGSDLKEDAIWFFWNLELYQFQVVFFFTILALQVCRMAVLTRAKATLSDCGTLDRMQPLEADDLINAVCKYSNRAKQMIDHGLDLFPQKRDRSLCEQSGYPVHPNSLPCAPKSPVIVLWLI